MRASSSRRRCRVGSSFSGLRVALATGLLATGLLACSKDEAAKESGKDKGGSPSASAVASGSGSAKAVPSAEVPKELAVTGAYDAKAGEVRLPKDAPPFLEPEGGGATGAGTLALVLPVADGDVSGTGDGALGAQVFYGRLEGGRLTGTLAPKAADGAPAFWGTVDANVDGKGDGRTVQGTLRASGKDGKVVREAAFTLKKK